MHFSVACAAPEQFEQNACRISPCKVCARSSLFLTFLESEDLVDSSNLFLCSRPQFGIDDAQIWPAHIGDLIGGRWNLLFFTFLISKSHRGAPGPFFPGVFLIATGATPRCRVPPLGVTSHGHLFFLKFLGDLAV